MIMLAFPASDRPVTRTINNRAVGFRQAAQRAEHVAMPPRQRPTIAEDDDDCRRSWWCTAFVSEIRLLIGRIRRRAG